MAFDGIHPTFRHVPPRDPRFSIHAVYIIVLSLRVRRDTSDTYPQSKLCRLDCSHVSSWAYTKNLSIEKPPFKVNVKTYLLQ